MGTRSERRRRTRRGSSTLWIAALAAVLGTTAAVGLDVTSTRASAWEAQRAAQAASSAALEAWRQTGSFDAGRHAAAAVLATQAVGGHAPALDAIAFGRWVDGRFIADGVRVEAARVGVRCRDVHPLVRLFEALPRPTVPPRRRAVPTASLEPDDRPDPTRAPPTEGA